MKEQRLSPIIQSLSVENLRHALFNPGLAGFGLLAEKKLRMYPLADRCETRNSWMFYSRCGVAG
jgi:hypothetical protein